VRNDCASCVLGLHVRLFKTFWFVLALLLVASPGCSQEYVAHLARPEDLKLPTGIPLDRLYRLDTVISGPAAAACAAGTALTSKAAFAIESRVPSALIDPSFPSRLVATSVAVAAAPPRGFVILLNGTDGWSVDSITLGPMPQNRNTAQLVQVTIRGTGRWSLSISGSARGQSYAIVSRPSKPSGSDGRFRWRSTARKSTTGMATAM
jgi:hypothetical protein